MAKAKKEREPWDPQSRDADPGATGAAPEAPRALAPGYNWCSTCHAAYKGEQCPGCSKGGLTIPDEAGEDSPDCLLHQFIKRDDGSFSCEKCGRVVGGNAVPSTLAEAAEQASIETKTVTETLKVPLTDEEYKALAIKMARANAEIGQAEDELASVKSQFKSRIDAAVAKRNEYAGILNAGCEYRPVDCELIKDYRENTITLVRKDTLEIVRTRTMTADERQRGLDFQAPPPIPQRAPSQAGDEEGQGQCIP